MIVDNQSEFETNCDWIVNIVLQGVEEEIECNVVGVATLAFSNFLTLLNQRVHLPLNFTEWNVVIEDVSHLLNDTMFKHIQDKQLLKFTVTPTDLPSFNISLTYLLHELRIVEPNCVKKVLCGINYVLASSKLKKKLVSRRVGGCSVYSLVSG